MEITLLEAARLIKEGQVVAVPTETVYGLAASLFNNNAIAQIFALKKRPADNPLIIHVAEIEEILNYTTCDKIDFINLATHFWPGPLTLVLPIFEDKVPSLVRAHLKTAAFRIPSHPIARDLIKKTGPLVMPSANLSGRPSSTCPFHVEEDFGKDFPVLNGGFSENGLESTILFFETSEKRWKIIRQGALSEEDFFPILKYTPEIIKHKKNETALCPGQLYRHYAPKTKLTLIKTIPINYEGVLVGFDETICPNQALFYSLGSLKNPKEISKNLYKVLRKLDQDHIKEALVDFNISNEGLLKTILERLFKASQQI